MRILFVVDRLTDWPLELPGVTVTSARDYLTSSDAGADTGTRVFNLCRSYRYQSIGYYVSLLAAARGHRPLPSVITSQDLRSQTLVRLTSEELEELIQKCLAPLEGNEFALSIYFGRNMAKKYQTLCVQLFNFFPAPMLRAHFVRQEGKWQLRSIKPIAAREIPDEHKEFVIEAAREYFARGRSSVSRRSFRYDLAILTNPHETQPPSDEKALRRFAKAAQSVGFRVEFVTADDFGRLAEFDALFIRETTQVTHHTFRFSRRAVAEGLVVIDDPDSIMRCTNKVYLNEILQRAKIPAPRTMVVHRDNLQEVGETLGFPCILKLPDSSFSQGVVRIDDSACLYEKAQKYLEDSELLIAQEFLPTEFDWRVGIIDRKVLYVCKYYMARRHWQIIKRDAEGRQVDDGKAEVIAPEDAPEKVIKLALKAANLIGNGLYGVDLKQKGQHCYVIEVNDNPSIEAGVEDKHLGEQLYRKIMKVFLDRVEKAKEDRYVL